MENIEEQNLEIPSIETAENVEIASFQMSVSNGDEEGTMEETPMEIIFETVDSIVDNALHSAAEVKQDLVLSTEDTIEVPSDTIMAPVQGTEETSGSSGHGSWNVSFCGHVSRGCERNGGPWYHRCFMVADDAAIPLDASSAGFNSPGTRLHS